MNLTSRIRERAPCSYIQRPWTGSCEQLIELSVSKISGTSLLASKKVSLLRGTEFSGAAYWLI
jgi:hypothetical protein